MRYWKTFGTLTTSLALAMTAFPSASTGASVARHRSENAISGQPSLQSFGEYQLAQADTNCRRVNTRTTPLNVRSTPRGRIIGSLPNATVVTIRNTGTNNWVPISEPINGYVYAPFLGLCEGIVPPSETPTATDNCRSITARGDALVRQQPSVNSPVVGRLASGQRVTIDNRGASGWVPISEPVNGYVSSANLTYCL